MKVLRAILLSVMLAGMSQAQAATPQYRTVEMTGHSYDRVTGAFLYTEHHRIVMWDDQVITHRIDYRDDEARVFVTKSLDYRSHPFAPDFRTTDLRDGYFEGGEHTARGYRLYRQLHEGAGTGSKVVPNSMDLVADSGFDRYVKTHLADWLRDGSGSIRMAIAGRLADYRFGVKLVERITLYEREAAVFRVQPSTLLSIFVDPIFVTYDIHTGHLLRYAGISNIRSSSGDRHDARIDFPPDGKPPIKPSNTTAGT